LGLIVGASSIISTDDRVKIYFNLDEMIDDGFDSSDPEYIAASLYFAQNPRPKKVAIGRWNNADPGGETIESALSDCRTKNIDWYAFIICRATKTNIIDAAGYTETAIPETTQFYTTADADVLAGTIGNVALTLKGLNYRRTLGQYCTLTLDAASAIMGYAMGANTGTANSSYTLAYKKEVGVTTENLTSNQVQALKNENCNIYVNRGNAYDLFEQGKMANGTSFDEVIGLDMLVNDIRMSVMDLLASSRKIPQTEDGVSLIINAISTACDKAVNRQFLAPGVWNAPGILTLKTGDTLSQGYIILAESIASQSQEDREARISPPIYVAIKLAGAIEFVVIQVLVNR
jgi:hypothetical protein